MTLVALSSQSSHRIELELHEVVTDVAHLRSCLSSVRNVIDRTNYTVSRQTNQSDENQNHARSVLGRPLTPGSLGIAKSSKNAPFSNVVRSASQDQGGELGPHHFILRLAQRWGCSVSCVCSCHQRKSFQNPTFLNQIIGTLFGNYNGVTLPFAGCDSKGCHISSELKGYVYYMFPRWMLDVAILMRLRLQGPEMLIRCLRTRQYMTTPAFQHHAHYQFGQVKDFIKNGQASVLDVSEYGSLFDVRLNLW